MGRPAEIGTPRQHIIQTRVSTEERDQIEAAAANDPTISAYARRVLLADATRKEKK